MQLENTSVMRLRTSVGVAIKHMIDAAGTGLQELMRTPQKFMAPLTLILIRTLQIVVHA